MNKKAKFLIEKYRYKYNLYAFKVDLDINKQSKGEELRFMRNRVFRLNPNFTIIERIYTDELGYFLKIEKLLDDKWVELDPKTYRIIKTKERPVM